MAEILAKHVLKIRYDGGSAEDHELPLYDGTASIQGIAQALQITTHAYLNNDIVTRATAMRGARMFLRPAKRGSFFVELVALIEQYPATSTSAVAISAPVFYDFIKIAFSKATGYLETEPETQHLKKTFEREEPFFDELAETLEGSLQRGHRVIGENITNISIGRPRSEIVLFDQKTKDWVNTREEIPTEETVTGNVTRFNSVTRNGRNVC